LSCYANETIVPPKCVTGTLSPLLGPSVAIIIFLEIIYPSFSVYYPFGFAAVAS